MNDLRQHRMPANERKQSILDTAIVLFAERGYADVSLQEIADRVGILKGSLYYHYKSKDDILYECCSMLQDHAERNRAVAEDVEGPKDRLLRLFVLHYESYATNIPLVKIFYSDFKSLPDDKYQEILSKRVEYNRYVTSLIAQAQKDGEISAAFDPRVLANLILTMLTGLHQWLTVETEEAFEFYRAQVQNAVARLLQ